MDTNEEAREPSALGRRVARLRTRLGYRKPAEFADAAGVARSIITKLETGDSQDAELPTLRKLAAALRVTVDALTAPGDADPPLAGTDAPATAPPDTIAAHRDRAASEAKYARIREAVADADRRLNAILAELDAPEG